MAPQAMSSHQLSETSPAKKRGKAGLVLVGVSGALVAGLYAVATPFIMPALRKVCLPYVPATTLQVENVLKALKGRSGNLVDIGSGDGRIVLAAAKHGFHSTGVELNPWLVWYSRLTARLRGLSHLAVFCRQDLWKMKTDCFSNVVIFGVPQMMSPLADKLLAELNTNSRIVACRFPFPHWVPQQTIGEGVDTVWVYDMDRLVITNDRLDNVCVDQNAESDEDR